MRVIGSQDISLTATFFWLGGVCVVAIFQSPFKVFSDACQVVGGADLAVSPSPSEPGGAYPADLDL